MGRVRQRSKKNEFCLFGWPSLRTAGSQSTRSLSEEGASYAEGASDLSLKGEKTGAFIDQTTLLHWVRATSEGAITPTKLLRLSKSHCFRERPMAEKHSMVWVLEVQYWCGLEPSTQLQLKSEVASKARLKGHPQQPLNS